MFIIGERINPAGKPDLIQAIQKAQPSLIQKEVQAQAKAGAQALDINVSLPDLDRPQAMRFVVEHIRMVSELPLLIDDRDPNVIEAGLVKAKANGWINSPLDSDDSEARICSLVRQFNARLFFLPLKGGHVPVDSNREYLKSVRTILNRLNAAGIQGIRHED